MSYERDETEVVALMGVFPTLAAHSTRKKQKMMFSGGKGTWYMVHRLDWVVSTLHSLTGGLPLLLTLPIRDL